VNTASGYSNAAQIEAQQEGAAGAAYVPAKIMFLTARIGAPRQRMVITSAGDIGMGPSFDPTYGCDINNGNLNGPFRVQSANEPIIRTYTDFSVQLGDLNGAGNDVRFLLDNSLSKIIELRNCRVGIDEAAPMSTLDVDGSVATNIQTTTTDLTIGDGNANNRVHTVLVDASGGNIIVDLPSAANNVGRMIIVKLIDTNGGLSTVSIRPQAGETLDQYTNAAPWTSTTQWDLLYVQADAGNWYIIGLR
jgi:hypothetical protein